jgi:hypothetical protein
MKPSLNPLFGDINEGVNSSTRIVLRKRNFQSFALKKKLQLLGVLLTREESGAVEMKLSQILAITTMVTVNKFAGSKKI